MIRYVKGDATDPIGTGPKILAHVCNDVGAWGAGFVKAISARWSEPERLYRAWFRGERVRPFVELELGRVQLVAVRNDLWVANMIGQSGLCTAHSIEGGTRPPIRYDSLRECLRVVCAHAMGLSFDASVHMPRIGCGLAGGRWEKVEPLVIAELHSRPLALCGRGLDITVYDL